MSVVTSPRSSRIAVRVDGSSALILDADGQPTWRYRVAPFAEAFHASGLDGSELDRLCGWSDSFHRKVLGLCASTNTRRGRDGTAHRYRYVRETLSYEHAVKLARALELNLVEWGV